MKDLLVNAWNNNKISTNNLGIDWLFVIAVATLLFMGLVMVFSSSIGINQSNLLPSTNFRHFYLQFAYMCIGLVLMMVFYIIPVIVWQNYSRLLLVLGIIVLTLVLIPGIGHEVNGSKRWIRVGSIQLQPSEVVKLWVMIYMAGYIARKGQALNDFKTGIMIPVLIIGAVSTLLMLEPDFGTTVVIAITIMTMLFLGGINLKHTILIIAVGSITLVLLAYSSEYRVARLTSFTNPWLDPFDKGFQLIQALIAIGRGEWLGVGLGNSVQKLEYLSHAHNDFIFAVIGEELGFVGIVFVILLFALLIWRILMLAKRASDVNFTFASSLCQGIAVMIGFQALINMGVNLGALPTKGLTLPFLSYGGSSIVMSCVTVGILLAINKEVYIRERNTKKTSVEATTENTADTHIQDMNEKLDKAITQ